MTARTFGRRGMAGGAVAAPPRRAAFGQRNPDHFEPIEFDEAALRRAAFRAEEHARRAPRPEGPELPLEPEPAPPTDRALNSAYMIWLISGLAGGHRFYLRRPLTGGVQAALFLGGWGAALAGYYAAFAGVALSCLWLIADGLMMVRLHRGSGPR